MILILAAIISLIGVRYYRILPFIPVLLWALAPSEAQSILGLSSSSMPHVSTLVTFFSLVFCAVFRPYIIEAAANKLGVLALPILFFAFYTSVVTYFSVEDVSISVNLNQIVSPLFLLFLTIGVVNYEKSSLRLLIQLLISLACFEAIFSIVQYVLKDFLFYSVIFKETVWWSNEYYRSVGSFDHFLVLGSFLSLCIPLAGFFKNSVYKLSYIALIISGIAFSQSRFSFILAAIGTVYVLLSTRSFAIKAISVLASAISLPLIVRLPVFAPIFMRFEDDQNSNEIRLKAYTWFRENWTDFIFSARGFGDSFNVASSAGLRSSFESAFIIYSIDFGIVFAVSYFSFFVILILKSKSEGYLKVAALISLMLPMTFSSIGVDSALASVIFFVVALSIAEAQKISEFSTKPTAVPRIHSD